VSLAAVGGFSTAEELVRNIIVFLFPCPEAGVLKKLSLAGLAS
jgi:hypothetical protein